MINNTTTLTEAVKALYNQNAQITVKEIQGAICGHSHLSVDYRKVYNTLKRVSGSSKASQKKKTSIIFDLSAPPAYTVKGVVVKRGQHCK